MPQFLHIHTRAFSRVLMLKHTLCWMKFACLYSSALKRICTTTSLSWIKRRRWSVWFLGEYLVSFTSGRILEMYGSATPINFTWIGKNCKCKNGSNHDTDDTKVGKELVQSSDILGPDFLGNFSVDVRVRDSDQSRVRDYLVTKTKFTPELDIVGKTDLLCQWRWAPVSIR